MNTKFKKFEPMTQVVNQKITELLSRGGTIILEKREFIEIKRMQSIAKIDQYGRVEWRSETQI
jgi:hypothetical protein